ncbi:MAG: hypothetical protein CMLOHMNK_00824 [Steroidobacteraceae bacterium]|nr:hypothetical protein [Steroidobacteraceae bacterium]
MAVIDAGGAIIPSQKLREYLLSATHPIGRYKAAFFTALGYTPEAWEVLERDLRDLLRGPVRELEVTEYGQKFATHGELKGPAGRKAAVVAVWITLVGETAPRFVTAYPED